jgi:DNA-binding NarL/FixJ family response regulator
MSIDGSPAGPGSRSARVSLASGDGDNNSNLVDAAFLLRRKAGQRGTLDVQGPRILPRLRNARCFKAGGPLTRRFVNCSETLHQKTGDCSSRRRKNRLPTMITPSGSSRRSDTELGIGKPQSSVITVLIAHCDPLISAGLATVLRERGDFKAVVCSPASTPEGMARLLSLADVVVADYDYGLRLIESGGADSHRVMILTHSSSEASVCRALEQGVRGYVLLGGSLENLIEDLRSIHAGGAALGPLVVTRMTDWMRQQTLTARQAEILRQLMLGFSNKIIARKLALSTGTVKSHVKAVLQKLGARSRTEAAAIAQRRGILEEECERSSPQVRPAGIGMPPGATPPRHRTVSDSRARQRPVSV